jgi:anaerobic selenocysteine-containing dehydrogenase
MTERTALRICPLCEACCGLELKIRGSEIISIEGDVADVFSKGYVCPKSVALKDLHQDPDRLTSPMIKRSGVHVKATWEEAFSEIESRLLGVRTALGNDAIGITVGNPAAHKIGLLMYFGQLARALGTKNIFSASTLDQMPKQLSSGLMFGHWLSIPVPDIDNTDLLVVIGANPMASNGSLWTVPDFRGKAKALKARGGKLIVIDPRRTETANIADKHYFIQPSTDVLFLAAIVNSLFSKNLVKLGNLTDWIKGIESIMKAVLPFTAERVEHACAIDAATIHELALKLSTTPKAVLYGRIGTCTQRFGTVASWLIDVINCLTGHLDSRGGAMFPKAPAFAANTQQRSGEKTKGVTTGRHQSRVSGAPEVYGELPMGVLAEEIETIGQGQIKALITVASNPVLSAPDGNRLSAAFSTLDFMLSLDIYINETTRFADVILPGLSPLEEAHYDVAFPQFSYRNQARYSEPVFAPQEGSMPEWQQLVKLAQLFGGPVADGVAAPAELLDASLRQGPYALTLNDLKSAPHGIDLGEMQPRIPEVLRTPSGLIELAPEQMLAELIQAEQLISAVKPEWTLIGRRDVRSNNSWMHNLPVLAKGPFRCTAFIHPRDANKLGLAEGMSVRISSAAQPEKVVIAQVALSDAMMTGVISLPHGWGHDKAGTKLQVAAQRPGVNMNELLDSSARDLPSGNAVLSGLSVNLECSVTSI